MKIKYLIIILLITNNWSTIAQVLDQKHIVNKIRDWSLEECMQHAIDNNITVTQSKISHLVSQNNLAQAKYNKLPTLTANTNHHYSIGRRIDPITSDFVNQRVSSTVVQTVATLTLWNGGLLNNQIQKRDLIVQRDAFYIEQTKNNIILSTVEAYMTALSCYESIKIATKTLENSQAQYDVAKGKFEVGALSRIDLSNFETQYANDQLQLVNAENNYKLQVLILKQLLELPPEINFDVKKISFNKDIAIPPTADLYQVALQVLPDIKLMNLENEVKAMDLKMAKAAYYPKLSFTGGISTGYTNTQLDPLATQFKNNFSPSIGLDISIPIFTQHNTKTNIKNAKMAIEHSKFETIRKEKELYNTLEKVIQNAYAAHAQLLASDVAAKAANMAYELANKKCELDALSAADLIIARNEYINAANRHIQAQLHHTLYLKLIEFYQGKLIK